ncbi:MAG TPA: hypothetical protein VJY47_01920 [Candidatus Dojkabacteria bacterium]|nr:hypothetical protein [Candidatus Dojkabacteria bacterium]
MNLQLTSPYIKCPYGCPYCVSAFEGENPYNDDFYNNNTELYLKRLDNVITNHNISTVVITGMTEPTLFPDFITNSLKILSKHKECKVEIQTANQNFKGLPEIDVVAYSMNKIPTKLPVADFGITRYTVILTDQLSYTDIVRLRERAGDDKQITVKYLQKTSNHHPKVDAYIEEHRQTFSTTEAQTLREKYNVWVDESCMDSTNRYLVYRTDGNLYSTWDFNSQIEI